MQTYWSAESTENWCVVGLKSTFSGLEELSFNSVSFSVKTNYVQWMRDQDTLIVHAVNLIEQSVKK